MNNNLFSLKNKNILITGASSGIGKSCAYKFAQLGANLIMLARNKESMNEVINSFDNPNNLVYTLDIEEYNNLEYVISDAVSKVGKISGFVHSAGIKMTAPISIMKSEFYEKMLNINVISALEIAKILSNRKYFSSDGMSIVFISSIAGIVGDIAITGYSASKGALIAATKSLALELASKKIRVNAISPGQIDDTNMAISLFENLDEEGILNFKKQYPLGLGSKDDVANACVFLLSDESKWITGTNLVVDGGFSCK